MSQRDGLGVGFTDLFGSGRQDFTHQFIIEDPAVIQKILAHLDDNATSAATALLPDSRASPTVGLFV
jgi:hypothetical protein